MPYIEKNQKELKRNNAAMFGTGHRQAIGRGGAANKLLLHMYDIRYIHPPHCYSHGDYDDGFVEVDRSMSSGQP